MTAICGHIDYDRTCCCDAKCAYHRPGLASSVICQPPVGVNPTFYSTADWNKAEEKLAWQASNEGLNYEPDWR
jgi:hypothetical protein